MGSDLAVRRVDALGPLPDLLTSDPALAALRSADVTGLVEVCLLPDERTAWVRTGSTIVAAGLAAGVEIVTGCTEGMCGTDPVRIRAGAAGLSEPEPHEVGTLLRMGLTAEYRLACSARVLTGRIEVETGTF